MNPESFFYGFGAAFGATWALGKLLNPSDRSRTSSEGARYSFGKESKGEAECRAAAYKITGKRFYKTRPQELINPDTGRALELDCFNDELMLAIEYQGRQHYEYVSVFHRGGKSDLRKQHERDCYKRSLCQKLGIRLIEVPYTVKNIEAYLEKVI
ncbi:hypothetical protein [Largemouth bass virus]|uniref:Uncharacterized protein n=1 Tax=Largemouth bass virus TaxID=176656 RepID=A0A9X7Y370_9VIRU|nr:hypothetical protein OA88_22660 [Flavobacterium sp. JRM]QJE49124.1 hypothetical protein LMBV_061 [Largemouth bass virus]WAK75120.1 putative P8.141C-like protein [Mandarin fish ranavirus]WHA35564.1 hypothetical protein MSRaV_76R [Micropterus salmoides ranavirus]WHA35669.1 hypothetical protein SCRaV_76R [Siniperca chuatsi ranavirus]